MEGIYGPEDIEQLLLSKDFSDLYPEERAYVLKHMDDESEYSAMRQMLLEFSSESISPAPPPALKAALISMHEQQHQKGGFKVWLNSLFTSLSPTMEWKRPVFQLAGLAGVLVLVILIVRSLTIGGVDKLAHAPNKDVNQEELAPQEKISPTLQGSTEDQGNLKSELESTTLGDNNGQSMSEVSNDEVNRNEDQVKTIEEDEEEIAEMDLGSAVELDMDYVVPDQEVSQREKFKSDDSSDDMLNKDVVSDSKIEPSVSTYYEANSPADEPAEELVTKITRPSAISTADAVADEITDLQTAHTTVPSALIASLYTAW